MTQKDRPNRMLKEQVERGDEEPGREGKASDAPAEGESSKKVTAPDPAEVKKWQEKAEHAKAYGREKPCAYCGFEKAEVLKTHDTRVHSEQHPPKVIIPRTLHCPRCGKSWRSSETYYLNQPPAADSTTDLEELYFPRV